MLCYFTKYCQIFEDLDFEDDREMEIEENTENVDDDGDEDNHIRGTDIRRREETERTTLQRNLY